ncbi:sulfhydryl oxidase [Monkeypox virus]|uniref:Sulfhydryl oxidase n=2 Tax=Monkeypox virus TaxID=10244 RepID=V9NQD3_MONPV|nr:Sulfhydryl oxidase [Monkeypox virus]AAL40516.1 F9R [Monkeypox virus Zaire-96-I-16]AGR34609.1 sulfhydryl oxidase [Monkeypox virus]AGR36519.1 sulfhydryl oxidase [Monkeypox virus]AGR36710.1 sulfhydryl oxidase [Monkeypox virus]AGR36901.1 sulfhydryl oxidase [Monkeypox virus]
MNPKHWGRAIWTIIFIVLSQAGLDGNIEACKRKIYTIVSTLPCPACRRHATIAIEDNNVMSSDDLNYIYYFFIRLFNNLAFDPKYAIDVSKVKPL